MEAALKVQQNVDPASIAAALDVRKTQANDFGGWDFWPKAESAREGYGTKLPATFVRVVPVDGDFDYGTNVYVMTRNVIVLGSIELRAGNASSALIASIASTLWSVR